MGERGVTRNIGSKLCTGRLEPVFGSNAQFDRQSVHLTSVKKTGKQAVSARMYISERKLYVLAGLYAFISCLDCGCVKVCQGTLTFELGLKAQPLNCQYRKI